MNFILVCHIHVLFPSPFSCSSVTFSWPLGASVILRAKKGKGRVQGWVCQMENIKNQTWKWHTKDGSIFFLKKTFSHMHLRDWLNLKRIKMAKRWDFWWTEVTFAREKLWDFFRQENSHHNPLWNSLSVSKTIIFSFFLSFLFKNIIPSFFINPFDIEINEIIEWFQVNVLEIIEYKMNDCNN